MLIYRFTNAQVRFTRLRVESSDNLLLQMPFRAFLSSQFPNQLAVSFHQPAPNRAVDDGFERFLNRGTGAPKA